jgi:phosphatidylglycerol:prolipoprotein diacylglycerol transferase
MISYILWNGSPIIYSFSSGSFALRWYGLLFALGFLISQQILYYMFRKEGKPEKDVDTLTIYMVVATILGARLGHILFYEPEIFWTNPASVFLPFEFSPEFKFTGLQGLASHGAAIGILTGLWLYSNLRLSFSNTEKGKKKGGIFFNKVRIGGQSYLQTLDRIVILVTLTGALIRMGNYFNSEIIGKPTDSSLGVVFIGRVTEALAGTEGDANPVETIGVVKNQALPDGANGRKPISIYVFFKPGIDQNTATNFVNQDAQFYLTRLSEYVDQPPLTPVEYKIETEASGNLVARIETFGVARHAAQLYESISCLLLFAFLFWYWSRYKEKLPEGRIFGIFMIVLWSLRFLYEFLKENQVSFEDNLTLNMGQILSIPLVLVGIIVLIRSYQKPGTPPAIE